MKILKIVSLLLVGSGIGIGLFLIIAKPFTPVTITYQKNSQQNYQYQQGYIDGLTSLKSEEDFKEGLSSNLAQESYHAGYLAGFNQSNIINLKGNNNNEPFYQNPEPGEYIFFHAISNCGDIRLSECKVIKQ